MEVLDIDKELSKVGIRERVIFYGVEHIYIRINSCGKSLAG